MGTKIIFNGKDIQDLKLTIEDVKNEITKSGAFSGSVDMKDTMFIFNLVKPELFDYYLDIFNKEKSLNKEVTFDIQTNVAKTISV